MVICAPTAGARPIVIGIALLLRNVSTSPAASDRMALPETFPVATSRLMAVLGFTVPLTATAIWLPMPAVIETE